MTAIRLGVDLGRGGPHGESSGTPWLDPADLRTVLAGRADLGE